MSCCTADVSRLPLLEPKLLKVSQESIGKLGNRRTPIGCGRMQAKDLDTLFSGLPRAGLLEEMMV